MIRRLLDLLLGTSPPPRISTRWDSEVDRYHEGGIPIP